MLQWGAGMEHARQVRKMPLWNNRRWWGWYIGTLSTQNTEEELCWGTEVNLLLWTATCGTVLQMAIQWLLMRPGVCHAPHQFVCYFLNHLTCKRHHVVCSVPQVGILIMIVLNLCSPLMKATQKPISNKPRRKRQISDKERDTYRSQRYNLYQKLNYQPESIGCLPISPFSNYFPLPLWTSFLSSSVHIKEHMASTGTTFAWDRLSLLVGTDLFFRLNSRSSLGRLLATPQNNKPTYGSTPVWQVYIHQLAVIKLCGIWGSKAVLRTVPMEQF